MRRGLKLEQANRKYQLSFQLLVEIEELLPTIVRPIRT